MDEIAISVLSGCLVVTIGIGFWQNITNRRLENEIATLDAENTELRDQLHEAESAIAVWRDAVRVREEQLDAADHRNGIVLDHNADLTRANAALIRENLKLKCAPRVAFTMLDNFLRLNSQN